MGSANPIRRLSTITAPGGEGGLFHEVAAGDSSSGWVGEFHGVDCCF